MSINEKKSAFEIVDMFQYPDVCLMVEWLNSEARKDKCADLIKALVEKDF